ncbi:MAG: sugar transferase, partial [Chloroflexi bacterium]|nr:sugar transferase [Chloroflexota bacterium]
MDLTIALLALIVLFPVMALIALAIVLDSPGPAIFRQKRVLGEQPLGAGRPEERTFEFLKFRTMYHNADQMVHQRYMHSLINGQAACGQQGLYKLGNDPRITRVGRFLRKTSLDELPQLVNVLCGEMSLVGPRPAIPYEVQQYKPWHLVRLSVKQGLTGLWQVTGRNHLTFDEM